MNKEFTVSFQKGYGPQWIDENVTDDSYNVHYYIVTVDEADINYIIGTLGYKIQSIELKYNTHIYNLKYFKNRSILDINMTNLTGFIVEGVYKQYVANAAERLEISNEISQYIEKKNIKLAPPPTPKEYKIIRKLRNTSGMTSNLRFVDKIDL